MALEIGIIISILHGKKLRQLAQGHTAVSDTALVQTQTQEHLF